MKPVDQTIYGPGKGAEAGNCMQAAVASLLDLPLDEVPHFAAEEGEDEWWWSFIRFARSIGYHVVTAEECLCVDALALVSGDSPRGAWKHLAVARGHEIVHDPHPSRSGFGDAIPDSWWYLVPLDPAAAVPTEAKGAPTGSNFGTMQDPYAAPSGEQTEAKENET